MPHLSNAQPSGHSEGCRGIRFQSDGKFKSEIMSKGTKSNSIRSAIDKAAEFGLARTKCDSGLSRAPMLDAVGAPKGDPTRRTTSGCPAPSEVRVDMDIKAVGVFLPPVLEHESGHPDQVAYEALQPQQRSLCWDSEFPAQLFGCVRKVWSIMRQMVRPCGERPEGGGAFGQQGCALLL